MTTLAQRLEALRTEAGYSRAGLCSALGFPKGSIDKFESGRVTPTKEQQAKLAGYFGVSVFYLRGESGDRTRLEDWMEIAPVERPDPLAALLQPPERGKSGKKAQPSTLELLLSSPEAKKLIQSAALEALHSPEGQVLLSHAIQRELSRRGL